MFRSHFLREIKGKELIQRIGDAFHISDPEKRHIVVSPTQKTPGRIIGDTQPVELEADEVFYKIYNLTYSKIKELIELWKQPYLVNVSIATLQSVNSVPHNGREVAADFSTPLVNLVPIFQTALKLGSEEFAFKAIEAPNPTSAVPEGPKGNRHFSLSVVHLFI